MKKLWLASCMLTTSAFLAHTAYAQTAANPPQTGLTIEQAFTSIGVDANLDDTSFPGYGSGQGLYFHLPVVESALAYLGLSQIRSGLPANTHQYPQSYQQAYDEEALSQLGYQFTLVFADYTYGIAFEQTQLDNLFSGEAGNGTPMAPGSLRIIEGLNEINNQNPQPTIAQATAWQQQLLCLTRQADFCPANSVDSNVAGSAVASFTSNGPVTTTPQPSQTFPADFANNHPYIEPSNNYLRSVLATIQNADQTVYSYTPQQVNSINGAAYQQPGGISTESGAYFEPYDSTRSDLRYLNGFDYHTMAIKDLDSILAHASLNQPSFLYQLFDNYDTVPDLNNPSTANYYTDSDNRNGLFVATGQNDSNGNPTYNPTPVATAIHNVVQLVTQNGLVLNPTGNNCLQHSISGLPSGASSLMLKVDNSNSYAIVLWWDNPNDWDKNTHLPVAVTPANVTINFQDAASGAVFDPMQGTNAISQYGPSLSAPISLGDDPLVVFVQTTNPNEVCS